MLLGREDVRNILRKFDAGFQPIQILNDLYRSGFSELVELAAVEQCLRDNGRQISNNQASNAAHGHQSHGVGHATSPSASTNHAASGPPAANQGALQVSAYAAVQNTTTGALYDPGPTLTWNDQADRFTISAHRFGKSVDEIWVTLRNNGYDIAKTEVMASLNGQGVLRGN